MENGIFLLLKFLLPRTFVPSEKDVKKLGLPVKALGSPQYIIISFEEDDLTELSTY